MKWIKLVLGQWRVILSGLVAAAIIHILVTLSSAQFSEAAAFRILSRGLPTNQVAFGKPVTARDQPIPFYNPDGLYSYCRYDASVARIRISASLPDAGWSLSLHTPKAENFYFVAGRNGRPTDIELILVPPSNVFAHGGTEVGRGSKQNIPLVKLPNVHGLAILKAPVKGFAFRRRIDELRASFKCKALDTTTAQR